MENFIPDPPKISEEQLDRCRETGDFCPILFEWYKFVSQLCITFASIQPDSPAAKPLPPIHYGVLVGLLARCSRLMLSNIALSNNGLFGETTAIIDRCIFESSVKLSWLCSKGSEESFNRFIADGLKTEITFKNKINENIQNRSGDILEIEKRMLKSIENYVSTSKLNEEQILNTMKLPDLASMIDSIGHKRILYIVGQKMGSHHVHGTWPSLWLHYLEMHDGYFAPRDHNCQTHVNQYVFTPLIVLESISNFVKFAFPSPDDSVGMVQLIESVAEEINKINEEVVGTDYTSAF